MKIVVCIKLVPAITDVKIDPETGTLIREGVESEVNPFDLYAIEEGIRLKEKHGGTVTALSMGPPQAERALRDAFARGCDDMILLTDRKFAGADTLATSYTLSRAIRKTSLYDLVICGHKTTDGDTGQVGPGLAEWLGIPHVSYVRKIIDVDDRSIVVDRSIDSSYEEIEAPLPCVITVTKEINVPRLPSLRRKIESRRMPLQVWTSEDLGREGRFGLEGSATRVIKVYDPPPRLGGELLRGDSQTQVRQLASRLKERHIL